MLRKILSNKSILDSVSLMLGTGIAQLLPILVSPILSRIYSPNDFGELAIFTSLSVICGMLSSGMFEMAIILPKKDTQAMNMVFIVFCQSLIVFCAIMGAVFIIGFFCNISSLYYLLAFSAVSSGYAQVYYNWLNRHKKYKILNFLRIAQSAVFILISILIYKISSFGMSIGYFVSMLFAGFPLFVLGITNRKMWNVKLLKYTYFQYSTFPRMLLPTSLMNTFGSYGPIFFIKKFYNNSVVGSFSMASRILTAPSAVISTAIGQVYYKTISDEIKNGNDIKNTFYKTFSFLLIVSFFIYVPLFFFGERISVYVLGDQWTEAGKYIEILAISSMIKFCISPLSTVLLATGKTKVLSKWQLGYFLTTILVLSCSFFLNIYFLLWIFIAHEIAQYGYYFYLMRKVLNK